MVVEGSACGAVSRYGDDSILGQIVSTVQDTQADKAPIQEIADQVSAYFVPVVTVVSAATFITWFSLAQSGAIPPDWYEEKYDSSALFAFLFALAVW